MQDSNSAMAISAESHQSRWLAYQHPPLGLDRQSYLHVINRIAGNTTCTKYCSLTRWFFLKVWFYARFAAPADSPAHLCDASNQAPGFVCESTGRRHHRADAMDQKMGSRFFTPPRLLALPPRPNLSFEAKSLRGCLDTAADALARKSIAAYPSSVNTGKCVLPHRSSISVPFSQRGCGARRWRTERHIWNTELNWSVLLLPITIG